MKKFLNAVKHCRNIARLGRFIYLLYFARKKITKNAFFRSYKAERTLKVRSRWRREQLAEWEFRFLQASFPSLVNANNKRFSYSCLFLSCENSKIPAQPIPLDCLTRVFSFSVTAVGDIRMHQKDSCCQSLSVLTIEFSSGLPRK